MFEGLSSAALLGALVYFLSDQTILVRAIAGAIIGAAAFVSIPAGISWALDQTSPVRLSVVCSPVVMPRTVPDGGYITIHLYPGGGASSASYGEAGSPTGYSGNEPAFRCEVRNQSGRELSALRVTLPAKYHPIQGKLPIESDTIESKISVIAPFLDARPEYPFTFYVQDPREFGVTISGIEITYERPTPRDRAIKISNQMINPIAFGRTQ